MTDFHMLSWRPDEAQLKKSSSATTARGTLVRIEILVTDPSCLSGMMRDIQEAMRPPAPKPKVEPERRPRLALPAPQLRLTDERDR